MNERTSRKLSAVFAAISVLFAILALMIAISGCNSIESDRMAAMAAGGYEGISIAKKHRETYIEETSPSPDIEAALRDGRPALGMSQDDIERGLGYFPDSRAIVGYTIVWFWSAGRHRRTFIFDGTHGKLIKIR